MNSKKTHIIFSSVLVVLTFMTSVIGQAVAPVAQPVNPLSDETSATKGSVYLEDISRLAAEGQIQTVEGLSAEVLKLVRALASLDRKDTILVDKHGTKHQAVVQNLAYNLFAGNASAGLKQKRILKINLG